MHATVLVTPEFSLPAALEAAWLAALPARRAAELRSWRDARDRWRSLLGTRLLLHAMQRIGIDDAAAALTTLAHAPQARPAIDRPLHFSISHTEGRIVCAVSPSVPVGADVEKIAGVDAAAFRYYLSADERAWAGSSPRRFATLWTRKEAVAKAAGSRGLSALPEIDALAPAGRVAHAGTHWRLLAIDVGTRHVAHVALAVDAGDTEGADAVTATIERLGRVELADATDPTVSSTADPRTP